MSSCDELQLVGFILISIQFLAGYSDGAQLQSYSACYGNTDENFIKGSCSPGHLIVMESVYVYAKPVSSGCPVEMTSTSEPSSCCTFDENDCGIKYAGESHREYYKNCDGKTTCITTPVAWIVTPNCNTITQYLTRTNYMVANFYCVTENHIQTISGNTSSTDAEVFLWNTGYPDGNMTHSSSYACSVAASCVSRLRVRALNLMLTSDGGTCSQSLTIKDGENTTVIGCDSNTDLIPTYIYTSDTYYLEIMANNTQNIDAGKFFLLITAIDPLANLTLACGTSKGQGYLNSTNIPQCSPTTTTQTTTPITTTTNQPSDNTGSAPQTGSSTAGDDSSTLIIIVVVVIALIVIIILILLLCRNKIKECCCKEKTPESDEKSMSSHFENPLLFGFVPGGTQVAPKSTMKPNHVAPDPFPEKAHNKLSLITLSNAGGQPINEASSHEEDDRNDDSVPHKPKRLPPIELFQAQQAFRENLKKVEKRKRRLQRKKEALKRRESEIQAKEAVIVQKERTLEKRLSGLSQSLGSGVDTNVPQQSVNPAPPRPLQRWSSILPSQAPSPSRKVTFGTLTNVLTAFRPPRSEAVCIDVTNADDGKLVSTHMNEEPC